MDLNRIWVLTVFNWLKSGPLKCSSEYGMEYSCPIEWGVIYWLTEWVTISVSRKALLLAVTDIFVRSESIGFHFSIHKTHFLFLDRYVKTVGSYTNVMLSVCPSSAVNFIYPTFRELALLFVFKRLVVIVLTTLLLLYYVSGDSQ